MYAAELVLSDGETVVALRDREQDAITFIQRARQWGVSHADAYYAPAKIMESRIVEYQDAAGSSPDRKPRAKRGTRKTSSSRRNPQD